MTPRAVVVRMRLLCLALVLLLPLASATSAPLVDDPAGDVDATGFAHADLRALSIEPTADGLALRVTLERLAAPPLGYACVVVFDVGGAARYAGLVASDDIHYFAGPFDRATMREGGVDEIRGSFEPGTPGVVTIQLPRAKLPPNATALERITVYTLDISGGLLDTPYRKLDEAGGAARLDLVPSVPTAPAPASIPSAPPAARTVPGEGLLGLVAAGALAVLGKGQDPSRSLRRREARSVRGVTLAVVLAALLVVPSASALGLFADGIDVAPTRAGDGLRYARVGVFDTGDEIRPANETIVVLAQGAAHGADRFGFERAADALEVRAWRGERASSERCLVLEGGVETVRRDVLAGVIYAGGSASANGPPVVTTRAQSASDEYVTRFRQPCAGANPEGGARLREGDPLPPVALAGLGLAMAPVTNASDPGVATEFQGREALRFAFHADAGGWVNVTLADGLPGIVEATLVGLGSVGTELSGFDTDTAPLRITLEGYARGEGAEASRYASAALPARHPEATAPANALALEDTAFHLAYPYADALAQVRDDPSACGAPGWFDQHPDARLAHASYAAKGHDAMVPTLAAEGIWQLMFVAGTDVCSAETARVAGAAGQRVVHTYPAEMPVLERPGALGAPMRAMPATVAPSALLAQLADANGVGRVEGLTYWGGSGSLELRDVPVFGPEQDGDYQGRMASLDAWSGAIRGVMATRGSVTHAITVDRPALSSLPPARSVAIMSGGPAVGVGLAALGALALVALLVKLALLPAYTRLRRASLLDNPVRARLYDRVRAEPGIHQAELVDFAGVGKGATVRHLDQLARHKLLVRLDVDGFARYYAAGEVPPEAARREAILRSDATRAVYELYAREPHISLRAAAERLGVAAPTVFRARKKLENAGLLPAAPEASVAVAA